CFAKSRTTKEKVRKWLQKGRAYPNLLTTKPDGMQAVRDGFEAYSDYLEEAIADEELSISEREMRFMSLMTQRGYSVQPPPSSGSGFRVPWWKPQEEKKR